MPGRMSVPRMGAVRPGPPSLAIRTPLAPAALALRAFTDMKHGTATHESDGAAREAGEGRALAAARGRVGLDGCDLGAHVSAARIAHRDEVAPAPELRRPGGEALEARRPCLSKQIEGERLKPGPVSGLAELRDYVGHRLLVPRRTCLTRPAVPAGNRRERREVTFQARRRDSASEGIGAGSSGTGSGFAAHRPRTRLQQGARRIAQA